MSHVLVHQIYQRSVPQGTTPLYVHHGCGQIPSRIHRQMGLTNSCLCRDQVSENIEQNAEDLFEEMGVETDETAGASLAQVQQLMPKRARR